MAGVADHLPLVDAGLRIEVFCNREKTEEEYSWNRQVISGIYHAKSISGGRLWYEKTVQDPNDMWWSLRFDAGLNQWFFMYSDIKIESFKQNENLSDVKGKFILARAAHVQNHLKVSFSAHQSHTKA